MAEPLVSVIIPTYNSQDTIEKTLYSVVNQSYRNLEIMVIDDGSTDATVESVNEVVNIDKRVKIITKERNSGVADSRNIGINLASGKYIAFLDGDDEWLLEKLEKQIAFMEHNHYDFTYTSYYLNQSGIESEKAVIRRAPTSLSYWDLMKYNYIGCLTVVINQEKTGKVSIPLLPKRNDYALWLRVLKKVDKAYLLDEPLSVYNVVEGSLSSGKKYKLMKHNFNVFHVSEGYGFIKSAFFTVRNILKYLVLRIKE